MTNVHTSLGKEMKVIKGRIDREERSIRRKTVGELQRHDCGELEGLSSVAGKVIFFQALKHDMSKGSKRVMEIRDE